MPAIQITRAEPMQQESSNARAAARAGVRAGFSSYGWWQRKQGNETAALLEVQGSAVLRREKKKQHWPVHKRVCIACKYSQRLLQLFAKDEDYQATLVGFKQQFEASDGGGRHAVGLICDSATVKAMCDKDSLANGG